MLPSSTPEVDAEIARLRDQIHTASARLAELQRSVPPVQIQDYPLITTDGPVMLSDFFQGKEDLIVIHNMGSDCDHCTLWADGFNGIESHVHDRAALLLVSADPAEQAENFANDRGWMFAVASGQGTEFSRDMGFESDGSPSPGMSTFHKDAEGKIYRVAQDEFGPGDRYCSILHLFARLKDGVKDWTPKSHYAHDDAPESAEETSGGCGAHCGCHAHDHS
jgi:predicted dithiol-disulfide oxidoreductase (DUF899 family)